MRLRNFTRAVGICVCLGTLILPLAAYAVNPAEAFVEESIRKGSAILDDNSLSSSERDREFRVFVLSITDMRRVALFTLGSYAKHATEDDIAGFVAAFTDLEVALYRNGFTSYGNSIRVTGSIIRAGDDVIVTAKAPGEDAKSDSMEISFRVRKGDNGQDIIVDVGLAGTWLALSQNEQFASYLRLNGGNIAKLSRELETHIAK